ncbi:MAG: cyclodehydratase, partial [Mycobacterium sp.]|nr:cyclodehydratase [Mycobacterium sp.]
MAQPTSPLYALDPALPVLLRPDGAVQVGWSPRRAVLIHPPRGLTPAGLATLLRTMHSPVPMSELQRQAARQGGVPAGELGELLARLVAAGVATRDRRQRPARSASIRVHGRGPLSELLIESLRCSGARVKQSSQPHAAVTSAEADLVVLSDNLVADPRMLR